jgi:hypothetical protein
MKLANGDRAVVDERKLRDYCLSPVHPRGRHKARVFASVLGIRQEDSALLRDALLQAARDGDATEGRINEYGRRYLLDFEMNGPLGRAEVRSFWIIRAGESFPRLTTCFVA